MDGALNGRSLNCRALSKSCLPSRISCKTLKLGNFAALLLRFVRVLVGRLAPGISFDEPEYLCFRGLYFRTSFWVSLQEVYTFTVGYHELTGSKVLLKKPLLVLKKVKLVGSEQGSDADLGTSRIELQVVGVIRHRLLFKTRPKALISSKPFNSNTHG